MLNKHWVFERLNKNKVTSNLSAFELSLRLHYNVIKISTAK